MTEYKAPHRAKPEVWADVERWCKNDMQTLNCTLELRDRVEALEAGLTTVALELRDRVEALEAAQRPTVKDSLTVPADSLVGRVADAIYNSATGGIREEARAAILAVADWFEQQGLHTRGARLRMEAQ